MKVLSRTEQRQRQTERVMLSLGLEAQLRLLIKDIRGGDMSKVQEFQQWLQYAPPEMKMRLLDELP